MSYTATEVQFHDRDQLLADLFLDQVIEEVLPLMRQYVRNIESCGYTACTHTLGYIADDIAAGKRVQHHLRMAINHFPGFAEYLGKREPDLIGVVAAACGGLYREL